VSKADIIFKHMCEDILDNGTSTEGEKVRPHWEDDGSPAHTIRKFGISNRYNLKEEFPALTLRRTALKRAMDEILWIYQRKSNNIHNLKSHIWDQWADDEGSIGCAYGYQVGKVSHYPDGDLDQMDRVLKDLKETPFSRRIMTNLWCTEELHLMHLYPCAFNAIYSVSDEHRDDGKLTLNLMLTQRSQDVLAANNWNVCQYAILLMMVAQVNDMVPGELVHNIADAHIYDRHIDAIRELLSREPKPAPRVSLNPDIHDFYDFTTDDLIVEDYDTWPQITNIPIAV
jgi:thymidylate synthase